MELIICIEKLLYSFQHKQTRSSATLPNVTISSNLVARTQS